MAGLDAQKALQLSALLAMTAQQFTASNPGQQQLAQNLLGSAQAGIQAEALKKAKKEEEKKSKGLLGGKLGSALGTAAGIALAPVTGGSSLALGALGGAAGGALGSAVSGGPVGGSDLLMNGLQGGMSAYSYGKAGELAQSVQNAGAPVADAAARPLAETLAQRALPPVEVLGSNPVGFEPPQQGGPMPYVQPDNFVNMKRAMGQPVPMAGGMAPSTNIGINASQPKQGLGQRFFGALQHQLTPPPAYKIQRNPDGIVDYWPN